MEKELTGNKPLKSRNSHANFRKGLNDYNDGENVTHHLGNDEYKNGANLSQPFEDEKNKLDGYSAEGNDFMEDVISEETSEENIFKEKPRSE